MRTIGFIGAGLIGATVARLSVNSGHDVVLSNSRDPKTLLPLAAALGPHARTGTPEQAATDGDLIIVTVPLNALTAVPVEPLIGKTVIDTSNYYKYRDGEIDKLTSRQITTSQILQDHLPESHVVKAFNNINFAHLGQLAEPRTSPTRTSLIIAGDDATAKDQVKDFLDSIGYGTVDAGRLSEGWRFDNGQPAYGDPYLLPGTDKTSIYDLGPGQPATDEELKRALEAADRTL